MYSFGGIDACQARIIANSVLFETANWAIEKLEDKIKYQSLRGCFTATLNIKREDCFNRDIVSQYFEDLGYGVSIINKEERCISNNPNPKDVVYTIELSL